MKTKLSLMAIAIIAMASCSKKPVTKEWAKAECLKNTSADTASTNLLTKALGKDGPDKFCDCIADKMAAKYKTTDEADLDKKGAEEIGIKCADELMKIASENTVPPVTK